MKTFEKGVVLRTAQHVVSAQQASQGLSLTESAQAEANSICLSIVPHTSVCGQHLAVISEAMLRLGNLLRTDHMLGGDQTTAFFNTLDHVLQELSEERGHNEP